MRESFLLHAKGLPSACERASLCMREGLFVHARRLVCACEGLPSACERPSLCMRKTFLLHAKELLCACETLLCACDRLAHASFVEGNLTRFPGRRERVSLSPLR